MQAHVPLAPCCACITMHNSSVICAFGHKPKHQFRNSASPGFESLAMTSTCFSHGASPPPGPDPTPMSAADARTASDIAALACGGSSSLTAPVLHFSAAMNKCDQCRRDGTEEAPLMQCARCRARAYCTVVCQKLDWGSHRSLCVPPEKARMRAAHRMGWAVLYQTAAQWMTSLSLAELHGLMAVCEQWGRLVRGAPRLFRRVDIRDVGSIDDAAVQRCLALAGGELKILHLEGLPRITSDAFSHLRHHPQLEAMHVLRCPEVVGASLRSKSFLFAFLGSRPRLKMLCLEGCQLEAEDVAHFERYTDRLDVFTCVECNGLSVEEAQCTSCDEPRTCGECADTKQCSECGEWCCAGEECDSFSCEKCDKLLCNDCGSILYCEKCGVFACEDCRRTCYCDYCEEYLCEGTERMKRGGGLRLHLSWVCCSVCCSGVLSRVSSRVR